MASKAERDLKRKDRGLNIKGMGSTPPREPIPKPPRRLAPPPPPPPGSRAAFGRVTNSAGRVEVECPHCGEQHSHLPADGSVQHCVNDSGKRYVVLIPLAELERLQ